MIIAKIVQSSDRRPREVRSFMLIAGALGAGLCACMSKNDVSARTATSPKRAQASIAPSLAADLHVLDAPTEAALCSWAMPREPCVVDVNGSDFQCMDTPGDPECGINPPLAQGAAFLEAPIAPWQSASIVGSRGDSIYDAINCSLHIETLTRWYAVSMGACSGAPSAGGLAAITITVDEFAVRQVVAHHTPQLLLRWTTHIHGTDEFNRSWMLCGNGRTARVSCASGSSDQVHQHISFP